ncbi:MAG: glycosyltransferase family 4 protein [Alphaproteobacteria bacterium]
MARIAIDARKFDDGGIGRYVREILARAPAELPDSEITAVVPPGAAERIRAVAPGVPTIEARSRGYSLAEQQELPRLLGGGRFDLVHFPHYAIPATLAGPRVVVTVHDLIHVRLPRSLLHEGYARIMLRVVRRRADLVLVPGAAVASDLATVGRFPAKKIRVVPNGVSDVFLAGGATSDGERSAFAERRGLVAPWLLHVTNGLPHKGLDVIAAALAQLPPIGLVLAGRGSDSPSVRAQVARGRLPGPVRFLGELSDDDLRTAYGAATAVVVASREEGFGLPALEAMASGGVVVATVAGGLAEVCGDAAVTVEAGSVASLRSALYRIVFELDPVEREGLVRRGLARAARFPWDRSVRATCAVYREALSGSP